MTELAWKSYTTDKTPPHPTGRAPMVEAWSAAVLMDGGNEVGHVWFTTCLDAVFADFTFDDSITLHVRACRPDLLRAVARSGRMLRRAALGTARGVAGARRD